MRGLGAFLLILAFLCAGCMGAAGKSSPSQTSPYEPYTHVVPLPTTGVEAREPSCDPRPCQEYYHIQIWGSENATLIKGPKEERLTCQKQWLFTTINANKTLQYNQATFSPAREKLRSVISTNFWGATINSRGVTDGCPTTYALEAYPTEYPHAYQRALGSYGAVRFNVYRDGLIAFEEDYFISIGDKIVVSYARQRIVDDSTYYVNGGFEIVNMGPWPMDGLVGQASGTVTRGPG